MRSKKCSLCKEDRFLKTPRTSFAWRSEDAQTGIRSAEVRFGEDQVMYLPIPTALPLETTEFELPTWGEVPEGVEPGEHDADLVFERVKSNVVTDRLTVPLKVTIRE